MTTINASSLFHGSFTFNGEQYANFASAVAAQGSDCRFRSYVEDQLVAKQPTVPCRGLRNSQRSILRRRKCR